MQITDALPDPQLPLPLQQHPQFAQTLCAMGRDACCLTLRSGPHRLGHAVMVARNTLVMGRFGLVSQGPYWANPPTIAERIDGFRGLSAQGVRLINATSGEDGALTDAGFRKVMTAAHIAQLDLRGGEDARRARMDVKWRNRLSRAERSGLRWRSLRYEGEADHWLLAEEARQQKAKKYKGFPPAFSAAWATQNPGKARLFVAYDGRERVAAMLFLMHGPVATYQIGWNGAIGREMHAHNLLLARASDWLADRGIRRIDLGTIDTEAAPGLARFKLGSGAEAIPLGGSWLRLTRAG
ncbi:GNAT family N-acetyltransferase [Loktanella sp. IMCC34160]|uniref:GNAT family N-acetyltransferase n=1 Tax=Loktanella sp. IMCC34160 TaxID=2510646 RepID=UPI00101B896F|nr:GNAT family N-acetyltransferase [Loktanella sp. IMCC34160]RYG91739.1 GNAT family N-acetyltransferase [Loktanella sp. IMCC34160]